MPFLALRRYAAFAAPIATLAVAVCAGCSPAARAPSPAACAAPVAPPYACRFTEEPPAIDGNVADAAWNNAVTIEDFSMPWLKASASGEIPRPTKATRAKLLWDREFLYVAADMDDDDLYADVTEHDAQTWDNDVFELFLKPAADKPAYYEFQVTARNTQFDCFIPRRGHVNRFRRMHDFGIESAVGLRGTLDDWTDRDEGWAVEMKIPWASLVRTGGRPEPGDEWRFAACRYDYDLARERPELSTCAPLSLLDFHLHEDYRPLVFEGPRVDTAKPPG